MAEIDDTITALNSALANLKNALTSARNLEGIDPADVELVEEAVCSAEKARDKFYTVACERGLPESIKVTPIKLKV